MQPRAILRAFQGAFLGVGAPVGWALIQTLRGINPFLDVAENTLLYSYMLFATVLVFTGFGFYVGLQESRSRESSRRDPLTRLFNLRYFREQLSSHLAQKRRDGTPVSLIFFDLDHFKKVNDSYGHAAGDKVLIEIATTVSQILRRNELLARIGGEEFAIIVPNNNADDAARLAERVRTTVAAHQFDIGARNMLQVTLSIGVAEHGSSDTSATLVERADTAMYEAKKGGRNQVHIKPNATSNLPD